MNSMSGTQKIDSDKNFNTGIEGKFNYKDNLELIKEYKRTKDQNILNIILVVNYRLIKSQANRYKKIVEGSCISIDDLIQVGYIGLIKAITKYDIERKVSFATYALYWIKQKMTREISNRLNVVRIPVYMGEEFLRLKRAEQMINQEIKGQKRIEEICKILSIDKEKYEEIKMYESLFGGRLTSLNIEIGEEEAVQLIEQISLDDKDEIFNKVSLKTLEDEIKKAFSSLSKREEDILTMRFGIKDGNEMTLEEIGNIYGLTRERIRQIESKALIKLKNNKILKCLKEEYIKN